MPTWKLNIFVRVVKRRVEVEGRTAKEVLADYPGLTTDEKTEIIAHL